MNRIASHLRSNAVAYLALFVALGGTSYAFAVPRNSVGTRQIRNHAITPVKLDPRMDAQAYLLSVLARGRVLAAERANAEARSVLQKVIDDVRTGASARAVAHHYAARASAADGDHAAADRHRALAKQLAPGTWIAA